MALICLTKVYPYLLGRGCTEKGSWKVKGMQSYPTSPQLLGRGCKEMDHENYWECSLILSWKSYKERVIEKWRECSSQTFPHMWFWRVFKIMNCVQFQKPVHSLLTCDFGECPQIYWLHCSSQLVTYTNFELVYFTRTYNFFQKLALARNSVTHTIFVITLITYTNCSRRSSWSKAISKFDCLKVMGEMPKVDQMEPQSFF